MFRILGKINIDLNVFINSKYYIQYTQLFDNFANLW